MATKRPPFYTPGPMAPGGDVWMPSAPVIQDFSQPMDYSGLGMPGGGDTPSSPFAPLADFNPQPSRLSTKMIDGQETWIPSKYMSPFMPQDETFTPPQNNPGGAIANDQLRLAGMGAEIPQRDEPGSLLSGVMGALNWIDRKTRGPVVTAIDELSTGGKNVAQALGEGAKVFSGDRPAVSGAQFVQHLGMPEDAFLGHVLGFGVDVVADPTTWVSLGGSAVAKQLGKAALKDTGVAVAKQAAERALFGEAGGVLGKEALGEYRTLARRGFENVRPGLELTQRAAESTTNRSLSGLFGAGVDDLARTSPGGVPGFVDDLSGKLMNEIPMKAPEFPSVPKLMSDDLLYHGTWAANAPDIMANGFKTGPGMFGEGVYFAKGAADPMYAAGAGRTAIGALAELKNPFMVTTKQEWEFVRDSIKQLEESFTRTGLANPGDHAKSLFTQKLMDQGFDGMEISYLQHVNPLGENVPWTVVFDPKKIMTQTPEALKAIEQGTELLKGNERFSGLLDKLSTTYGTPVKAKDLAGMTGTQLATLDTLTDTFGPNVALDRLTQASASLGATYKSGELKGIKKLSKFMDTTFATELEAAKAIEEARAPIGYAQKLIATVEKGDLWFRVGVPFTGKHVDLIELTPVKEFTGKLLQQAWNSAPPVVKDVIDLMGESFVPKYLKQYTSLLPSGAQSDLGEAASKVYNFGREQKSTLGIAGREVVRGLDVKDIAKTMGEGVFERAVAQVDPALLKSLEISSIHDISTKIALGPELAGNQKVMEALSYYMEKGVLDGGNEALGITSYAAHKWDEVAKTLSTEELALVKQGAAKATLMHEIQKQIDLKILDTAAPKARAAEAAARYTLPGSEYVPHIYDWKATPDRVIMSGDARVVAATSARHASMEARTIKSLAQAEALHAAGDLAAKPLNNMAVLMAGRLSYTRRSMLASQLVEDLKMLTGVVSKSKSIPGVPSELIELTRAFEGTEVTSMNHVASGLKGFYAHPEIVRHLRTLDNLMFNDAAQNQFLRWASTVTNLVKGAQLSANASFTLRNIMGEGFMAFVDGVGPGTVGEAIKGLRGTKDTLQIGRMTLNAEEELNAFGKLGGWFGGSKARDFVTSATKTLEREVKIAAKGGAGLNPLMHVNDFNDKMWRFAHYLEYRGKGFGVRDAVAEIRKFHVDYEDLTKFERHVMKNVVPFYTYMRKNLPNVLRMTLEQPFAYSMVGHLVNSAYEALGNPTTSDYLKENLALPIFRRANGDMVLLNWNLPIVDLARLKNPFSQEGAAEIGKSLNPMLSVPAQLAFNQNLATGSSIAHFPSDNANRAKFVINQLGAIPRAVGDTNFAQESLGMQQQGLNRPDQVPIPTVSSVLPIQRPVSVYTSNQYKYRDQLQNEIAKRQASGEIVPTRSMLKHGSLKPIPNLGKDDIWYPGKQ